MSQIICVNGFCCQFASKILIISIPSVAAVSRMATTSATIEFIFLLPWSRYVLYIYIYIYILMNLMIFLSFLALFIDFAVQPLQLAT